VDIAAVAVRASSTSSWTATGSPATTRGVGRPADAAASRSLGVMRLSMALAEAIQRTTRPRTVCGPSSPPSGARRTQGLPLPQCRCRNAGGGVSGTGHQGIPRLGGTLLPRTRRRHRGNRLKSAGRCAYRALQRGAYHRDDHRARARRGDDRQTHRAAHLGSREGFQLGLITAAAT
jgi:hypothetical protein